MPYLYDIWWTRAEGMHAEFWTWHILIKYLILHNLFKTLSGAFFRNRLPHLYDIWYVGRTQAEGMLNFGRGICWSPGTPGVNNVRQRFMTTKRGQKNH